MINFNFIPSLIPVRNLDQRLHDLGTTFHFGSSVQSAMKNGMNSVRNELELKLNSYVIGKYLPRRSRGEYSSIITDPNVNHCFSIIT